MKAPVLLVALFALFLAAPVAASPSLLDDGGYGLLRPGTKLTRAAVQSAFPQATVVERAFEDEGGDVPGFEVQLDGKVVVNVFGEHLLFITTRFLTTRGLTVGSTYEQLRAAYPRTVCDADPMYGSVDCKPPKSRLTFVFDQQVKDVAVGRVDEHPAACSATESACCDIGGRCNAAAMKGATMNMIDLDLSPPRRK